MKGRHSQVVQFLLSKGATVSTIYVRIMLSRLAYNMLVINVNEGHNVL